MREEGREKREGMNDGRPNMRGEDGREGDVGAEVGGGVP